MAISNVETGTSKTDYDVRAHKSNSRNGNSKTHGKHEKAEQPGESPRKEDSVTISDEAKELSERKELRFSIYDWEEGPLALKRPEIGTPEWEEQRNRVRELAEDKKYRFAVEQAGTYENYIYNALEGKVENPYEVAVQLGKMLYSYSSSLEFDKYGYNQPSSTLESRAENREASRDLAKYIAENHFDDPKEAQAFIDKINKYIERYELLDKGYVANFAEQEPMKPNPPSDEERWIDANWDKYFGHLNITHNEGSSKYLLALALKSTSDEEFKEAYRAAMQDFRKEQLASFEKNPAPYSVSKTKPTWEEDKEYNCKYSMYNEQNKAWYAEFDAKSKIAQDIINKAKSITDFSGNERWNIVMNLISGNKTTQEHL